MKVGEWDVSEEGSEEARRAIKMIKGTGRATVGTAEESDWLKAPELSLAFRIPWISCNKRLLGTKSARWCRHREPEAPRSWLQLELKH